MGGREREAKSLFERCEAASREARAVAERTREVLAESREARSRYLDAVQDGARFVRRATAALRAAVIDARDGGDVQPPAAPGVPISEGMDGRVEKFPDREPSSPVGDHHEA